MLDPEYLAQLPEPILRLWRKAEQQILADMARRISTYDYWIPAADHQAARLRVAGHTQEDILAALAPITRKSEAELRQMMIDAGSRCLADNIELYHAAGLDVPDPAKHAGLKATLNTGYQQTAQTMRNLTRTTAQTATQQFESALDRAWLQVSSGAFDYDAAIRGAVKDLSEAGVAAIRYPSGRVDSIETAVRRAVLTGVNQTAGKLQMELADEVGCDLVEVTAHAGARPSHAVWQGKIYSRSGKSEKYPDFVSSTGYGTGAGLCGWNCRHSFGPYIEGSPRVWTDEKLEELNEPRYEYQGEKLTEYEAQQKENYFNRQIHRWEREAEAMKAAGQDPSEARAKARGWRARKRDFLENRTKIAKTDLAFIPIDVKAEYFSSAAPGKGGILFEPGYDVGPMHENERITAQWLHDTFGGDIILQTESEKDGEKRADFSWRRHQWELKNTSSVKAVDAAVRKGLKQIRTNPGGIILDFGNNDVSVDDVKGALQKRMRFSSSMQVDIIVVKDKTAVAIWRFKK